MELCYLNTKGGWGTSQPPSQDDKRSSLSAKNGGKAVPKPPKITTHQDARSKQDPSQPHLFLKLFRCSDILPALSHHPLPQFTPPKHSVTYEKFLQMKNLNLEGDIEKLAPIIIYDHTMDLLKESWSHVLNQRGDICHYLDQLQWGYQCLLKLCNKSYEIINPETLVFKLKIQQDNLTKLQSTKPNKDIQEKMGLVSISLISLKKSIPPSHRSCL